MKRILYIILSAGLLLGGGSLRAQQVNTLYFMDNVPMRQYLNPAFQPLSNVYISFPAVGYTSFGLMNNSLALKDVVQYRDGRTMLFLNPDNTDGRNNFLRALREVHRHGDYATVGVRGIIQLILYAGCQQQGGHCRSTISYSDICLSHIH